jgi:ligand-binding sensor domain-containing protein
MLWSASTGGLARLAQGTWQPVGKEMGYDGGTIDLAGVAKDGRLWFVAGGRYFVLRPDARQFVQLNEVMFETDVLGLSQYVPQLDNDGTYLVDKSGALWVGSRDGLERIRWLDDPSGAKRKVTEVFGTAQGLSGSASGVGFEDREGNLWFSTTRGIEQFRQNRFTPVTFPNSVFMAIVAIDDTGVVWTGDEWGAYRLADRLSRVAALGDHISAMSKDRSGTIWVAGGAHSTRLYTITRGNVAPVPVPRELETADTEYNYASMATDGADALWVSVTAYGLYRLKDGNWTRFDQIAGLPTQHIWRVVADDRNRLWLTFAEDRIAVLDADSAHVYGAADGLSVGAATALTFRGDSIWVGGINGVQFLDHGRFVSLAMKNEQRLDGVSGLIERSNGELWVQCNAGVIRIPADEIARARRDPAFRVQGEVFGEDDGVPGNANPLGPGPTLFEEKDGRLWVATAGGLAWIDPAHIRRNRVAPEVVFNAVRADGKAYQVSDEVRLPELTRNLSIEYTAASLTMPNRVTFRYKLDGVDNGWQDSGNRRESYYTNLDPGSYLFHVSAANEDGVPSRREASLTLVITPALYQTGWFHSLYVVVPFILLCLAFVVYFRLRVQRARIRTRERERIARDLHDTLLQGAQALLFRVEVAADRPMEEGTRRMLIDATNAARAVVMEGREKVSLLREELLIEHPVEMLRDFAEALALTNPTQFHLHVEGTPRVFNRLSGEELVSVLKEALNNAFFHARAKRIDLRLSFGWFRFIASLDDDGVGIDEAILKAGRREGHWGMPGMFERVRQLGGKLTVHSIRGRGTKIVIVMPAYRIY